MLNEVDGLQAIIPLIKKEWVDQILFVDGGSADGTLDYLKKNNCEYIVQKRRGLRHAYSETLPHIRGDALIIFRPDGNSIPGRIPDLIAKYQE